MTRAYDQKVMRLTFCQKNFTKIIPNDSAVTLLLQRLPIHKTSYSQFPWYLGKLSQHCGFLFESCVVESSGSHMSSLTNWTQCNPLSDQEANLQEVHLQLNTIEARQESEKILQQAYQLEELGLALKQAADSNGGDHIIYQDDHGAECICLDGKSGYEYDPNRDYLVTKVAWHRDLKEALRGLFLCSIRVFRFVLI